MASHSLGLTLYEAARQKGVSFTQENEPTDNTVQANGMNFHYLEWGQPGNPLIVMLHGGSQQAHSWDFVSLPLSEDFHIIALDQRGHGDSDWPPTRTTLWKPTKPILTASFKLWGFPTSISSATRWADATATSGPPATRTSSGRW